MTNIKEEIEKEIEGIPYYSIKETALVIESEKVKKIIFSALDRQRDEILKVCVKQEILNWKKTHEGHRFGQWLWHAINRNYECLDDEDVANRLFFIEDQELVDLLDK